MARKLDRNLVVGLDIGTSKVAAIVGEMKEDGEIEVIGIGTHPSRGLKKGRGGQSGGHGAVDSARHRRGGTDVRLPDTLCVRRHSGQPYQ